MLLKIPDSQTFATFYERTVRFSLVSHSECQIVQEVELFTGILQNPQDKYPQAYAHRPSINAAAMSASGRILAIAASARGLVSEHHQNVKDSSSSSGGGNSSSAAA